MSYKVYVLQSRTTDKIYIGYTKRLTIRLKRHNQELPNKKSSYTSKNTGPWLLKYKESYPSRHEAIRREKELKSYQGRKYIKEKVLGP